jgi:hypothetical protein
MKARTIERLKEEMDYLFDQAEKCGKLANQSQAKQYYEDMGRWIRRMNQYHDQARGVARALDLIKQYEEEVVE